MISRKSIWQALKRNDLTGQADTHGRTQTLSSGFQKRPQVLMFS